ncbi:PhoH family protein [Portibacter marinus]|uniref:PhoH family protein n=1 Tax=Portibacter marinus TaxID=2898660 RepID=UPI001F1D515D|nr:PhoH family protein [Portibacter marinus]
MTQQRSRKLFVLDTSVLLFDHNAINNFEEHDVVIPITVLEELDNFKVGTETKNFEARMVVRLLDELSGKTGLNNWKSLGSKKGNIKIVAPPANLRTNAEHVFGSIKNDHTILNVALSLHEKSRSRKVILVTKDINLRLKARALGLGAEDYQTGKVEDLADISNKTPEFHNLSSEIIRDLYQKKTIPESGILNGSKLANGYYILNNCTETALARYDEVTDSLHRVDKKYAYGVKPKNAGQTFAMDALMNDDIKLIALQGVAGSGKTLLALAAALEQKTKFNQIILSRPIVPLSNRDIGFLPGDAEDKISPYMQPLWDNLKFIKSQFRENERKSKALEDLQESGQLSLTALTFIRGRSLSNVIFIIDEAQNLTPHEMKTIITRAGEGTKIIFTGDIYQIDSPYMDAHSNGLSYLIDRFKGNKIFAHIKLEKGERSELANLANELL